MTELEFPKIVVPRLPQNTSNVNTECAGKSKLFFLCDQLLGALIHLNFLILIIICFKLMVPVVNYVIHDCSSGRTTPGVSLYRSLTLGGKFCCSYYARQGGR